MKKLLLLISIALFYLTSYSQDKDGFYFHLFKVNNITNYGDAKILIIEMRKKTGEKIFYFNDTTDTFKLKTRQIYLNNEFIELLLNNNIHVIE